MENDPILWGALNLRRRPTAQLLWSIEPDDETNPAEAEAAKLIEYIVKRIPRFQKLKMFLLEAIWYGKYAVELVYRWREHRGQQMLFVHDFIPINGDKMRFKWDGTPGFLVYAGYPGTKESTDYGLAHFLTADERLQYIIHEHEPRDVDWTLPEMAGAIHGVGVRGKLYWFWWLKQQVFAQLMNYLHRFANGLTIFYYQAGNPQAKEEAELAARQQFSNAALLYPRWPGENPDVNGVERLEVGTANSNLLWNLISDYFDPIMEKYILGQTLSHDTDATGLGSGVADLHAATLAEIIKYDAIDLQETLQTDLIDVLYSYNCPGVRPGKFSFTVESPDSDKLMGYAQMLYQMGVPMDEDEIYEIAQLSKPKPGNGIVTQVGAMSPAAVGGVPQGVPVSGQAGEGQPQPDGMEMPQSYSRNGHKKLVKSVPSGFLAMPKSSRTKSHAQYRQRSR
jgi:phage gp29-like protein